jgi:hypothetical protein
MREKVGRKTSEQERENKKYNSNKKIANMCYSELSNMKVYYSIFREKCYFKWSVGGRKMLNLTKRLI